MGRMHVCIAVSNARYIAIIEKMTMIVLCVVAHILCSVVEVHSQTAPYLTFMGQTLPNNSYVNLSLVGLGGTADVDSGFEIICHSDLETCCRSENGHGEWFFPNGTQLPGVGFNNSNKVAIAIRRLDQRVRLQRGPVSGDIPSGMYRCDIETIAVSDQGGSGRESVYVGLYGSGGMYNIMFT